MEICAPDIVLCIAPKQKKDDSFYNDQQAPPLSEDTHDFTLQRLTTAPSFKGVQVVLESDALRVKEWTVDRVIDPDSSSPEVNDKLVEYVIQGYDVAALFINIGDIQQLCGQQQNNFHSILSSMQAAFDKLFMEKNIKMEYAFLEISDNMYRDLRKEKDYSKEEFVRQGGIDSVLREVYSLNEVWVKVEQSNEAPSILVIQVTNDTDCTVGRLLFINLSQPDSNSTESKYACYQTYNYIHDTIHSIYGNINLFNGHIHVDNHIVQDELTKYLCSQSKLAVYIYLNDTIDDQQLSNETVKCLDMFTKLRNTPIKMIKNKIAFASPREHKRKMYIEELKEYNNNLKIAKAEVEKTRDEFKMQAKLQRDLNEELQERMTFLQAEQKVKDSQIQYLKVAKQQTYIESDLYAKALSREIDVLRALTDSQTTYIAEFMNEKHTAPAQKIFNFKSTNNQKPPKLQKTVKFGKTKSAEDKHSVQQ